MIIETLQSRTKLRPLARLLLPTCAVGLVLAGCGSSGGSSTTTGASSSGAAGSTQTTQTTETQAAAAGDIPDNQHFLNYRNPQAGYSVKYPEGWARTGSASDVTFADKDNQVHIAVGSGATPTVASARAALAKSAPTMLQVKSVTTQQVSGSPAIHLVYTELGKPDPVTGKALTIMVDRYLFAKSGKVATVDESTPVGVDNVDAYRLIAESFKWG